MITIEELAGYLPYGLNAETLNRTVKIITLSGFYCTTGTNDLRFNSQELEGGIGVEEIKPLLRPLSSLTTEQEINGEMVVPLEELRKKYNSINSNEIEVVEFYFDDIDGFCLYGLDFSGDEIAFPLFMYRQLYYWHFDLHGLIERGDAINLLEYKTR